MQRFLHAMRFGSLRTRLLVGVVVFSLVIVALGGGGIVAGGRALESMDKIYTHDAAAVELLADIRSNMLEAVVASGQMRGAPAQQKAALLPAAKAYIRQASDSWRRYKRLPADAAATVRNAGFERVFDPARIETERYIDAIHADDQGAIAAIDARIDAIWGRYVDATAMLVASNKARSQARYQDSVDFFRRFDLLAWIAIGGGIVLAACAQRGFVTGLLRPLDAAVRNCELIAAGDLTARLPSVRADSEIGRLVAGFALMQRDLSRAVSAVMSGAQEINTATREIAQGTLDLSRRTEGQAASLEVTAANVNTLADTVRQNADSAGTALQMTAQAGKVAQHCKGAVAAVIATMGKVSQSAARMSDVVAAMESIAFQTQILALNAAVEAARAGDQGRGFAVVATEVGVLAQRAAAAARDIDQLIRTAGNEVRTCAVQAEDAGSTMDCMVTEMAGVAAIAGDVARTSHRQTGDIARVNEAVGRIDAATQQNAALVEQVSAASAALAEQSEALAAAMAVFKPLPAPASGAAHLALS